MTSAANSMGIPAYMRITPKNVRNSKISVLRVHGLSPGDRIATLNTGRPPARCPWCGSFETDTRARSSNGGYPGRGSRANLRHGLERSNRKR